MFERRINVYSAHDTTIANLWRGFNVIEKLEFPSYGAALMIELHEIDDKYQVKVSFILILIQMYLLTIFVQLMVLIFRFANTRAWKKQRRWSVYFPSSYFKNNWHFFIIIRGYIFQNWTPWTTSYIHCSVVLYSGQSFWLLKKIEKITAPTISLIFCTDTASETTYA